MVLGLGPIFFRNSLRNSDTTLGLGSFATLTSDCFELLRFELISVFATLTSIVAPKGFVLTVVALENATLTGADAVSVPCLGIHPRITDGAHVFAAEPAASSHNPWPDSRTSQSDPLVHWPWLFQANK